MIRKIIAKDKNLVTYRPALRELGGSIAGTVLLQQIIYWDDKMGGKFFKFSEPPKDGHKMYKSGDSWSEELGMSAKELRTALNHFAFKCGKKNKSKFGDEYETKRNSSLVQYYTDSQRVTWYMLNRTLLNKLLLGIYKESDQAEVINTQETTPETTTENNYVATAPAEASDSTDKKPNVVAGGAKEWNAPALDAVEEWARGWAEEKRLNPHKVVNAAREGWRYYERMDWVDSRGKKVKNWKLKIKSVWLGNDKIDELWKKKKSTGPGFDLIM